MTESCFILMIKYLFLQLSDNQAFKAKLQLTLLT